MAGNKKEAAETVEVQESNTVTLVNKSSRLAIVAGAHIAPGDAVEVDLSALDVWGVKHLIAAGDLVIKDQSDKTNEIAEEFKKGAKKPAKQPIEDGPEFS